MFLLPSVDPVEFSIPRVKRRRPWWTDGNAESVRDMEQGSREERFTALATLVSEPLRRYVGRRADPDTAQDILADALVVLWRRLVDVPTDDPLPWCYAVTRGSLANATRAAYRQWRLVDRLSLAQSRASSEPVLDDADVHDALGRLPEQDRELVRLWAWEQLAPHEIAVVLGVTPNAVRIRLHRARAKLGQLLEGPEWFRRGRTGTGDREEARMNDEDRRGRRAADSWTSDQVEATMSTTPEEPTTRSAPVGASNGSSRNTGRDRRRCIHPPGWQ